MAGTGSFGTDLRFVRSRTLLLSTWLAGLSLVSQENLLLYCFHLLSLDRFAAVQQLSLLLFSLLLQSEEVRLELDRPLDVADLVQFADLREDLLNVRKLLRLLPPAALVASVLQVLRLLDLAGHLDLLLELFLARVCFLFLVSLLV